MPIPVVSPVAYIRYSQLLHFAPPPIETDKLGPLPQFYADMFGWEEMTVEAARIYNSLPPDRRPKTAILAGTYGQAAPIDLFGPKYGLPQSISPHQSYFFCVPRHYTLDSIILMGIHRQRLE